MDNSIKKEDKYLELQKIEELIDQYANVESPDYVYKRYLTERKYELVRELEDE